MSIQKNFSEKESKQNNASFCDYIEAYICLLLRSIWMYICLLLRNLWILISTVGFIFLRFPKSNCVKMMDKEFEVNGDESRKNLEKNFDLAKISFEEIKHLTEYEDEKANRILSAVTFLSALSGVLFVSLIPKNIMGELIPIQELNIFGILFYFMFGLFVIFLVVGAIGIIGSIEPRFNLGAMKGNSILFAPLVVKSEPAEWAKNFNCNNEGDLKVEFTKCYVRESYLIAEKIINKLRYLEPSVQIIRFSIVILFIWIILSGIMIYVSPVNKQLNTKVQPSQVSSNPLIDKFPGESFLNSNISIKE